MEAARWLTRPWDLVIRSPSPPIAVAAPFGADQTPQHSPAERRGLHAPTQLPAWTHPLEGNRRDHLHHRPSLTPHTVKDPPDHREAGSGALHRHAGARLDPAHRRRLNGSQSRGADRLRMPAAPHTLAADRPFHLSAVVVGYARGWTPPVRCRRGRLKAWRRTSPRSACLTW
jgi:hypothetical protein